MSRSCDRAVVRSSRTGDLRSGAPTRSGNQRQRDRDRQRRQRRNEQRGAPSPPDHDGRHERRREGRPESHRRDDDAGRAALEGGRHPARHALRRRRVGRRGRHAHQEPERHEPGQHGRHARAPRAPAGRGLERRQRHPGPGRQGEDAPGAPPVRHDAARHLEQRVPEQERAEHPAHRHLAQAELLHEERAGGGDVDAADVAGGRCGEQHRDERPARFLRERRGGMTASRYRGRAADFGLPAVPASRPAAEHRLRAGSRMRRRASRTRRKSCG